MERGMSKSQKSSHRVQNRLFQTKSSSVLREDQVESTRTEFHPSSGFRFNVDDVSVVAKEERSGGSVD